MKKFVAVFAACVFAAASYAQSGCESGRFYEPVFSDVEVTSAVEFGENAQPTIFDPNATQVLELDVYEPQGDTMQQRPLIIWAFGGAFVAGSRQSPDIVELCNRFAETGYVCASIDYRLTPELALAGDAYLATYAVMKATHDMRAAVRFFRKDAATTNTYRINPSAIYVGGVSAGGFAALHTAYLDEAAEIPPVLVNDTAEIGGLEGLSGNAGYSSDVAGVLNLCGALGDDDWMQAGDQPLMSVHGTADDVVPYDNSVLTLLGINMEVHGSESLHLRAHVLGIPNSFTPFPGAGHTPFVLGTSTESYMDTTWWASRDFMYQQVCDQPFAVPELSANGLKELSCWPVPALNQVRVEAQNAASAQLFDVAGKQHSAAVEQTENGLLLNLEALPDGLYIVVAFDRAGNQLGRASVLLER